MADDAQRLRTLRIPAFQISEENRRRIGARVIQVVKERIAAAVNLEDSPVKAYSPRGPIYIPLTWADERQRIGPTGDILRQQRRETTQLRLTGLDRRLLWRAANGRPFIDTDGKTGTAVLVQRLVDK